MNLTLKRGKPIFDIIDFIHENGNIIKKNEETYNSVNDEYVFNKLVLTIPSNLDVTELKDSIIGEGCNIDIITNVKISYPTPSHYKVDLKILTLMYTQSRLISSEIPNTSYTFNENLIETNFWVSFL